MPTIAAYGSQYLERGELAATSRDRCRQLFKFYILAEPATITRRGMVKGKPVAKHGIGGVRVTELTRADVRLWWQGLPVSTRESSCRQAYDLLRAIMNAAVEAELIEVNPVQVKAATQAQASRERDLDPLPIDVLYAVAEQMPERWRLGVLLGGVLGLRSGEVRALQRRDFSLNGEVPTVKVHQSVKEAEGKVVIGPLKTARKGIAFRTLPIPAALVGDVRSQAARAATETGLLAAPYEDTPLLDLAAIVAAEGDRQAAERILCDAVGNRAEAGEAPDDLPARTADLISSPPWHRSGRVA